MRELLRRFTDFQRLDPTALAVVAGRTRRLRVPARRWLVRPGRSLAGRFYLLEGRVQLVTDGRSIIVNAGSARARRAVYPGAAGVETLTATRFLNVATLEPAGEAGAIGRLGVPELVVEESSWQRRLLTSPLMERLDPVIWQRVLSAMRRSSFEAGERVIRAGDSADCCYVLCSGLADIRASDGRPLAALAPGQLFGEDALISGGQRSADVVMRTDGAVMALEACRFRSWLLDEVVQPIDGPQGRMVIDLDPGGLAGLRVAVPSLRQVAMALSRERSYAITGGSEAERTLAAFLLAERGIDARPISTPRRFTLVSSDPAPTP